jgi:hypothetical protein
MKHDFFDTTADDDAAMLAIKKLFGTFFGS